MPVRNNNCRHAKAPGDQDYELDPISLKIARRPCRGALLNWFCRVRHNRLLFLGRRNSADMSLGRWIFPVENVTFSALEGGVCFLLIDFQIQDTVGGCFDMTPGPFARARFHLGPRSLIERVQGRDIMTARTAQARMRNPLVSKLRSISSAPSL